MKLTEKQLAIHITTRCTLNCKLCATIMPIFREHERGWIPLCGTIPHCGSELELFKNNTDNFAGFHGMGAGIQEKREKHFPLTRPLETAAERM